MAKREQARALAHASAGVVVGSALVTAAAEGGAMKAARVAREVVAGLTL